MTLNDHDHKIQEPWAEVERLQKRVAELEAEAERLRPLAVNNSYAEERRSRLRERAKRLELEIAVEKAKTALARALADGVGLRAEIEQLKSENAALRRLRGE